MNQPFEIPAIFALGLLLALIVANVYAMSRKSYTELLWGNLYFVSSIYTVFTGDFVKLFIGLELMTIMATFLLFNREDQNSYLIAKRYFLTHVVGASLILIGIVYTVTLNHNTAIINLYSYINSLSLLNTKSLIYILMIVGFLIKIAAFPFSGWMLKSYPKSSTSSFIYLVNFTTKVNLIILYKLFSGVSWLKFIGIIMLIQSAIGVCFEQNLRRIFCYVSLISTAISLIAVSVSFEPSALYQIYLFTDILFKTLLAVAILIIQDNAQIINANDFAKLKNYKHHFIILISIIIGLIPIYGFLGLDVPNCIKYLITFELPPHLLPIISFTSLITIFGIVSIKFLPDKYKGDLNEVMIGQSFKYSLLIPLILIIIASTILLFPLFVFITVTTFDKQLMILLIAMILAYFIKPPRFNTMPINIDILYFIYRAFQYMFSNKIAPHTNKQEQQLLITQKIEKSNFNRFLKHLYNQNTSILIIFGLLMMLILFLN